MSVRAINPFMNGYNQKINPVNQVQGQTEFAQALGVSQPLSPSSSTIGTQVPSEKLTFGGKTDPFSVSATAVNNMQRQYGSAEMPNIPWAKENQQNGLSLLQAGQQVDEQRGKNLHIIA